MRLLTSDAVRRCFIADRGHLIISADFDQIEFRIAAALAGERKLIRAAKRGESLHKTAAIALFGKTYTPDQYRFTKNVNFGWLFGGGATTLSEQTGLPKTTTQRTIKQYEAAFPALVAYKRSLQRSIMAQVLTSDEQRTYRALRNELFTYRHGSTGFKRIQSRITRMLYGRIGYVRTDYGRILPVEANKAYKAMNYKVQSSARDVFAEALLRVMETPTLRGTVLLPIHDEILGQAPKNQATEMAKAYGEVMSTTLRGVPLTATGKVYGRSWGHGYRKE